VSLAIDHLEQVSVHRLAKEQSLEARRAKCIDERSAGKHDAPAERGEVVDVGEERDGPPELRQEG
jgi:hypothetical protein